MHYWANICFHSDCFSLDLFAVNFCIKICINRTPVIKFRQFLSLNESYLELFELLFDLCWNQTFLVALFWSLVVPKLYLLISWALYRNTHFHVAGNFIKILTLLVYEGDPLVMYDVLFLEIHSGHVKLVRAN